MRLQINLSGFLEEVPEDTALPYLLKMYLREVENLDINIDPLNPHDTEIRSNTADVKYQYHLTDDDFYITLDYKPV